MKVDVRGENIGTNGYASKSVALRSVVKQTSRGQCCTHTQPPHNPPMGTQQPKGCLTGNNTLVYVLNMDGRPLMPTARCGWVRRSIRSGAVVVVSRCPFTVRLTYACPNIVQGVTLGVDAGSKHVGLSATTTVRELYAGQCDLRSDITELISARRALRKNRRYRKTRYRKSRFTNRGTKAGHLQPSVTCKVDEHIRAISSIYRILPISRIVVEVAQFDLRRIVDPCVSGSAYGVGEQSGFWNVREYVLARDNHTCQHCFGRSKDAVLNVHHIESRRTGGDAPNNLVTLCKTCHAAYHSGRISLTCKRGTTFRDAATMNCIRMAVYKQLTAVYGDVSMTYGYETKTKRIALGIKKSHAADAYCVAGNMGAERRGYTFYSKFIRRHNRMLHRITPIRGGIRRPAQTAKVMHGFRHFDAVWYNNAVCYVASRRTNGSFKVVDAYGRCVNGGINWKKLRRIRSSGTLLTMLIHTDSI